MARPRNSKSKNPFMGLGLKPEEEVRFKELLEEKAIHGRQLVKALVRQWIREGGHGVLTYTSPPKIYKH
jgi:hypothetical protein